MEITPQKLQHDQEAFKRAQQQSAADGNELRIKLIENAIIVKAGPAGWFAFDDWPKASAHIAARIDVLKAKRKAGA